MPQNPKTSDNNENKNTPPKYHISFDYKDERVFITVEFEEALERRSHKTWVWDPISQAYIEDKDTETSFILLIRDSSDQHFADVWVWRAFISDPAQIAEDCYAIVRNNSILEIKRDSGELCWQPVYYDHFAGEKLPRFKHKKPSGSYADVSAKGEWTNGKWKIILSRSRITENKDDISFEWGKKYSFSIFQPENQEPCDELLIDFNRKNLSSDKTN